MTIHDELIRELIRLDSRSKPTGKIVHIAGRANIKINLELYYAHPSPNIDKIVPDIVFEDLSFKTHPINDRRVAIEMESDMHWDFAASLRQVHNYRSSGLFKKVIVIIPYEYRRFAPYYRNEGFEVWLWKATRIWECMRCSNIMEEKRTVQPRCSECGKTEQRLKGIKDADLKEKASDFPNSIKNL